MWCSSAKQPKKSTRHSTRLLVHSRLPWKSAKVWRKQFRQPPKWPSQVVSSCFHRVAPVLTNSSISKNVERPFENGYRNFRKPDCSTCRSTNQALTHPHRGPDPDRGRC